MRKLLLLLSLFFAAICTCSAVDIPRGTIYFDNSVTKYKTVKFAYGYENATKGTILVTMTKGENDIWSYKFNNSVTNVYRYIFLETSKNDNT